MRMMVLVSAMSCTCPVFADLVADLATDVLPSLQSGWAYFPYGCNAGVPETSVYFPGPEFMVMDTMGIRPQSCQAANRLEYRIDPVLIERGTYRAETRARVTDSEFFVYQYGFSFGGYLDDKVVSIGLMTDTLSLPDLSMMPWDATGWHDYAIVYQLPGYEFELWIDGQFFLTGPARDIDPYPNTFIIGDSTGGANARVEIASYHAELVLACNAADLVPPFNLLDLADINAFVTGFVSLDPIADLNADGLFDLLDVNIFVGSFLAGCP
ncbi:MAG: hypothetical protein H6810_07100 [Phycisphaeraceae bacterium]|nr:MAG: hypothetical protein H6810_07100 [Phycisphaeraceae bacterium]